MPVSLVLVLALIGISFAGPLTRLSHAHPLAIAIWRLGLALVVVLVALVTTGSWRQLRRLDRQGLLIAMATGVLLAVHFWTWNASVGLTTVSASVVLVNMQPALVAFLSTVWLREPPSNRQWFGIAVAMVGAAVVALPDISALHGAATGTAFLGDALALAGAAAAACYVVAGRRLRGTLDVWPYVAVVYGTSLIVLIGFAAAVHAPVLGQPPREMEIFLALAIGPMLFGHTGLNWALKYLPAYIVTLTLLGEPVGATLLAAVLPGIREVPSISTFIGGGLILAGVWVTARAPRSSTDVARPAPGVAPLSPRLPD